MQAATIITLLVSQFIITIFAILISYLKIRQEIRKFKEEKIYDVKLDRIKRQLSEFYGPLYMLTTSTSKIAKTAWGTDIFKDVRKNILIPSNKEVAKILLTKIDLLEEEEIPESYFQFLNHVNVSSSYIELEISYFEKDSFYPMQFNRGVASSYRKKRKEYIELLKSI